MHGLVPWVMAPRVMARATMGKNDTNIHKFLSLIRGFYFRNPWAGVKRLTSHEPNRMLMRENKEFVSFAFDSAHVSTAFGPDLGRF